MRKMITGKQAEQIEKNKEDISSIEGEITSLKNSAPVAISGKFVDTDDTLYVILTEINPYKDPEESNYNCTALESGTGIILEIIIKFEDSQIWSVGGSQIHLNSAAVYLTNLNTNQNIEELDI